MKEGWEIKKITDVLWFQEGPGVRKHQYVSNGIKLLNVANLVEGKVDLSTSDRYISVDEAYGRYKHFLVDEGDLILASSGIQVEYIDKKIGFIKKEHLPLCMNTSTIRFKSLDVNRLNIVFFKYFLKSYNFKRQLFSLITGCAQLNFGPSHLKQMFLPIPPLSEQERIVEELDCLSGVIEKKKQQLKELDALAQSIFYEMFVDVCNEWDKIRLIDIYRFIDYRGKTPNKIAEGIPLITARNIRKGYIDYSVREYISEVEFAQRQSRGVARKGDLLFTTEAPMGYVAIADLEVFSTGQRLITFQKKETIAVDNIYVLHCLLSDRFQSELNNQATGATVKGIKGSKLEQMRIECPPLSLQQQFAEKIEMIEKQKELIRKSIGEVEMLFNSRMDYYFG